MAVPLQEALTLAFLAANGLRLVAYMPQIAALARCAPGAGTNVSVLTWSLFAVSNLTTALYAAAVLADDRMALLFAGNVACCTVITGLALRCRARGAATGPGHRRSGGRRPTPANDLGAPTPSLEAGGLRAASAMAATAGASRP